MVAPHVVLDECHAVITRQLSGTDHEAVKRPSNFDS